MTPELIEIRETQHGLPARTPTQRARLVLIFKPFPPIMADRRLPPSYPWSGTIVGDSFFGNPHYDFRRPGAADDALDLVEA